jgi:hypothetical protein
MATWEQWLWPRKNQTGPRPRSEPGTSWTRPTWRCLFISLCRHSKVHNYLHETLQQNLRLIRDGRQPKAPVVRPSDKETEVSMWYAGCNAASNTPTHAMYFNVVKSFKFLKHINKSCHMMTPSGISLPVYIQWQQNGVIEIENSFSKRNLC